MNKTDQRILAEYNKGKTLERIAKIIGRPGDIQRVKEGLRRMGKVKEK